MERAFDVLKKWAILTNPAPTSLQRIRNMMYTCVILHNMMRKNKSNAISPNQYPEETHESNNLLRSHEQTLQVMGQIKSSQVHQNLRVDLVETFLVKFN